MQMKVSPTNLEPWRSKSLVGKPQLCLFGSAVLLVGCFWGAMPKPPSFSAAFHPAKSVPSLAFLQHTIHKTEY